MNISLLYAVTSIALIMQVAGFFGSKLARQSRIFPKPFYHEPPINALFGKLQSMSTDTCDSSVNMEPSAWFRHTQDGDWAGQCSKFDSKDGSVIPVPQHLVPKSMVEWGQIPPQLEVFTSDKWTNSHENLFQLDRTSITVLPEVGCGIDNLETIKSKETILVSLDSSTCDNTKNQFIIKPDQPAKGAIISKNEPSKIQALVTVAPKPNQLNSLLINLYLTYKNSPDSSCRRIRITLDTIIHHDKSQLDILSPIVVVQERQTSTTPTTAAFLGDGGGLDARTVAQLVGIQNINKPFSTQHPVSIFDSDLDYCKMVKLAGGVSLRWGTLENDQSIIIDVGVLHDMKTHHDDSKECHSNFIVRMNITRTNMETYLFKVVHFTEYQSNQ